MLKSILYLASSTAIGQGTGVLRSFVLVKFLKPGDYGVLVVAQTILYLSPLLSLGTGETLVKNIPYYLGTKESQKRRNLEATVLGSNFIVALTAIAVALCCGALGSFEWVRANSVFIRITLLSVALYFVSGYYAIRCAAYADFKTVSVIDAVRAVSSTACLLWGAWQWGLVGAFWGTLASEGIVCVAAVALCTAKHGFVSPSFHCKPLFRAIAVGFPISITWWIYMLQASVGRLSAASLLGRAATGFYGFSFSIASAFSTIPNSVGRVLYPKVSGSLGAGDEGYIVKDAVLGPTMILSTVLPFFQMFVILALPVLYAEIVPKYSPGLESAQILILSCYWIALFRTGANYLIAINEQSFVLLCVVVSVLANATFSLSLVLLGFGICGLAFGTFFATLVLGVLVWVRVLRRLEPSEHTRRRIFIGLCVPFMVAVCEMLFLYMMGARYAREDVAMYATYAAGTVAFLVVVNLIVPSTRVELKKILAFAGRVRLRASLSSGSSLKGH